MFQHNCLQDHLSSVRWESYKVTASDTDTDSEIWLRYQENIVLCQNFYPYLHLFEISLRNHLQKILQPVDPHWYSYTVNSKGDYTYNGKLFTSIGLNKIKEVNQKLRLGKKGKNYVPTEGQVVAGLTLGFWVDLLSNTYIQYLWPFKNNNIQNLEQLFPNIPKNLINQKNAIGDIIYPKLKAIVFLRNRIFHYEPIWDDRHFNSFPKKSLLLQSVNASVLDYSVIYDVLIEVLGWLCEDLLQDAHTFRKA